MSPAIARNIRRAAREMNADGIVSSDTMMALAADGYELSALELDIERLNTNPQT